MHSRRYGGSSSSIFGKRPTGGLKRLSALSSLHWLTSPSSTLPVPFSTSKSWYSPRVTDMLSPGSRRTCVPAGTVRTRPSVCTVTGLSRSISSLGRLLYTRISTLPPPRLIMSSVLNQWKWLGHFWPSLRYSSFSA